MRVTLWAPSRSQKWRYVNKIFFWIFFSFYSMNWLTHFSCVKLPGEITVTDWIIQRSRVSPNTVHSTQYTVQLVISLSQIRHQNNLCEAVNCLMSCQGQLWIIFSDHDWRPGHAFSILAHYSQDCPITFINGPDFSGSFPLDYSVSPVRQIDR